MFDTSDYAKVYRRERLKNCAKALGLGITIYVFFAVVVFPSIVCGCQKNGGIARRSACVSNMKQLGLAMMQYTQDYDGELPPVSQPVGKGTWREAIYPYVKATDVYRCPDTNPAKDTPQNLPHSYGANAVGWNKRLSASPSIAIVDMNGFAGPDWNLISPAFLPGTGRELHAHVPNHAFYEHPHGPVNCLFTDGHVKSFKPMATLTPVNLWMRDNTPFAGQELNNARAILQHAEEE